MTTFYIHVNDNNVKKTNNNAAFQIGRDELEGQTPIILSKKDSTRLLKSKEKHTGLRFAANSYEIGVGEDLDIGEDIEGGSIFKPFTKTIKKVKGIGRKKVNKLLDDGEEYTTMQFNTASKSVTNELKRLQEYTDDKTDDMIDSVDEKITKQLSVMNKNVQKQNDMMQANIDTFLNKEIDQAVDAEELTGGKINWKRMRRRLKKSATKFINKNKNLTAKQFGNKLLKEGKNYALDNVNNVGSKAIGAAANYVVPGSGGVVTIAAKAGLDHVNKRGATKGSGFYASGSGIEKHTGKCIKGSQAAKDKMAFVRAKRKLKGAGFMPSGK